MPDLGIIICKRIGTSMNLITPISLHGKYVHLIPLSMDHTDGLMQASQDGNLWELWYASVPKPENIKTEIERRLKLQQQGLMLPFTVIEPSQQRIVGMTTYMNIEAAKPRLEIGSTWYAKSVHRTALNTEAKLLLLQHAFEHINCIAVEFRTHYLNQQSRRAIERLGAKLDGVLRNHLRIANGTLRDTCVYSILNTEWPAINAHLQHKLNNY